MVALLERCSTSGSQSHVWLKEATARHEFCKMRLSLEWGERARVGCGSRFSLSPRAELLWRFGGCSQGTGPPGRRSSVATAIVTMLLRFPTSDENWWWKQSCRSINGYLLMESHDFNRELLLTPAAEPSGEIAWRVWQKRDNGTFGTMS